MDLSGNETFYRSIVLVVHARQFVRAMIKHEFLPIQDFKLYIPPRPNGIHSRPLQELFD